MTRSLFFAFLLRLAVSMGLILALHTWLLPLSWPLQILLVLAWASVSAWFLMRSIRHSIRPLQTAASLLASQRPRPSPEPSGTLVPNLASQIQDQRYSDFDALARALSRAAREVDHALSAAAASRDELIAIIDSLHDAVLAVDGSGRILWSNQPMERLVSADALSSTSGVRIGYALVQTIRDPEVLKCVGAALDQRSFAQGRSTSLAPGRIVEVNASPMPSGGAVALLRDITRFEQIERTQRDFVANVSHELRTPLTSIVGYVETLLDHESALSEAGRSFLTTILKNATRMNRLTEDLLTITKVESSEQRLQPAALPARSLVQEAVQAVSGLVEDSHAKLEVNVEATVREVFADRDATIQVLVNLIENAIKYGRSRASGEARVLVAVREIQQPAPAVEFSVRDFGVGIASEHTARIFERFYRVDKARSFESGGTGLGLAIARHIVEQQGGHIRVESELNRGSNFLFTLPPAEAPAEDAAPESAQRLRSILPDVTSA